MRGILFILAALLLLGCIGTEEAQQEPEEELVADAECEGCYTGEEEEVEDAEETEVEETEGEEPEEELPEEENETEEEEPEYPATGCSGPSEYDVFTADYVIYNGMRYNDTCIVYDVVKEYYCKNDTMKTINDECPPGYWCKFGECIIFEGLCEDSDGNDTNYKGYVTVSDAPLSTYKETDSCVDGATVREWKCNGSEAYNELLFCGSGYMCEEGRCIRSDCEDSDGGDIPQIAGEVEKGDETRKDDCEDDYELKEYYCYGNKIQSKIYECENRCTNDQCIPVEEEE